MARKGYPRKNRLTCFERIVMVASNEDDVVLDPFCGCGTTIHAAQKLRRRWIGIDINLANFPRPRRSSYSSFAAIFSLASGMLFRPLATTKAQPTNATH
jgi:DNA modification methylase